MFVGRFLYFAFILGLFSNCSLAQEPAPEKKPDYSNWTELTKGMEYREIDAPIKSFIGDSKLSILRLDPSQFQFDIYSATQYDSVPKNAYSWADTFHLNVVFNAGMYSLGSPLHSRAFLQSKDHINNGKILENFNLMMALGPKNPAERANIEVLDLTCANWEQEKQHFHSYAQGLRMIDCNGTPMNWQKRVQSCSMLVAAEDEKGWFYLVFTRSPYTHNQMIGFLKEMPGQLHDAIYLEGGPETSLLIDVNGHCIEKVGSWVSNTWARDDNDHFWPLPNVVGIKPLPKK